MGRVGTETLSHGMMSSDVYFSETKLRNNSDPLYPVNGKKARLEVVGSVGGCFHPGEGKQGSAKMVAGALEGNESEKNNF